MFILFFVISVNILIFGICYMSFKWNKIEKDLIKDENADNYLFAKEIFVRDPEAFKDKDHDGIDDIIDKNIK